MAQEEELNLLYHFRREAEGDPVEIILIIQMRWDVSSASEGAGGRQPQFTGGCSCRVMERLQMEMILLSAQST